MAWIEQVEPERAEGLLKQQLEAAHRRAGRIWNIVGVMSLNPAVLKASMDLYKAIMMRPSPLDRRARELLATVVAAELDCFY